MILGKHTILKLIFIILLILALSSCSGIKEKAEENLERDESEAMVEQRASIEAAVREPLYVYKNQPEGIASRNVTLTLNEEPLLLPNGYVRLVGVVSGGRPMALVEVGGRGLCVEIGNRVGDYRVVSILAKKIRLKFKGGN